MTGYGRAVQTFENREITVEILEEKDGWMKIESGGATGYVSAEYVTTGEKAKKLVIYVNSIQK